MSSINQSITVNKGCYLIEFCCNNQLSTCNVKTSLVYSDRCLHGDGHTSPSVVRDAQLGCQWLACYLFIASVVFPCDDQLLLFPVALCSTVYHVSGHGWTTIASDIWRLTIRSPLVWQGQSLVVRCSDLYHVHRMIRQVSSCDTLVFKGLKSASSCHINRTHQRQENDRVQNIEHKPTRRRSWALRLPSHEEQNDRPILRLLEDPHQNVTILLHVVIGNPCILLMQLNYLSTPVFIELMNKILVN